MGIAIITGATSGIGEEFAIQLDKVNSIDEFWLIGRNRDKLNDLKNQLKTPVKLFSLDLTIQQNFDTIMSSLEQEKPIVEVLVNSAGFGLNGDFCELSLNEQLSMVDLNVKAVMSLTHISVPFMKQGSRIINISSIAGEAPLGAFAVYGASKSFLTHFSVALAVELKEKGISITTVLPGSVDTNFQKRSRGNSNRKKKLFAKKSTPQEVVEKAIKDSEKGKLYSVFGLTAKFAILFSKIVTKRFSADLAYNKIYSKE